MVCLFFTSTCFAATTSEIKELEKLAAQGNAVAQFNLGVLYDTGDGVKQNYVKARE